MDEKGFTASLGRNISTRDALQKSQTYLLQNYARADLVLERGNGVYVFDNDGERYLDCVSGLAVNALGHGDYDDLELIREQSATLITFRISITRFPVHYSPRQPREKSPSPIGCSSVTPAPRRSRLR